MTDGYRPPRWARIYVKSGLAHLLEGGTGSMGSGGGFRHKRASALPVRDGHHAPNGIGETGSVSGGAGNLMSAVAIHRGRSSGRRIQAVQDRSSRWQMRRLRIPGRG